MPFYVQYMIYMVAQMYTAADTKQNKCSCALCLSPWTVYINGSIRFAMTICVSVDCCLCVCIWSQYLIQSKCIESVALLVCFACPARCYTETPLDSVERESERVSCSSRKRMSLYGKQFYILLYARNSKWFFFSFFFCPLFFHIVHCLQFDYFYFLFRGLYAFLSSVRLTTATQRSLATATTTAYGYDAHNQ